uniref:Dachshund b n=1 Tax=Neogobius melanostomus TaxID=47308 RepID=A0A8C6S8N7_9GOBI
MWISARVRFRAIKQIIQDLPSLFSFCSLTFFLPFLYFIHKKTENDQTLSFSLGLTAAAMAELQKLQKMKMMMSLQNGNESDNEDLHSNTGNFYYECSWEKERLTSPRLRPSVGHLWGEPGQHLRGRGLELPFMMMPHPLLPMGLPPASVAMQIHTHVHRAPVIKERVCDSPSLSPSGDENTSPLQSQPSSSASSSPERLEESSLGQTLPPGFPAPFLFADGLSSVETLLTNIQGLLKVAVENARVQDKQIQAEKRELKMELFREREMRESLERQLTSELQSRASIQKRLKKEKKAKRKLQEALEFESKRRERVEDALKHSSSSSPSPEPHHNNKNGNYQPSVTASSQNKGALSRAGR